MGILACDRPRCENIMCHTLIHSVGYICNECENEFKESIKNTEFQNNYQLEQALIGFMNTDKGATIVSQVDVNQFFNNHRME